MQQAPFKPTGTFTNDADIDIYVKAVLGKNSPPPRGALPSTENAEQDELPLEEAFNAAAASARKQATAPAGTETAESKPEQVDLFEKYR